MARWRPAAADERDAAVTRIGGQPSWTRTPRWPVGGDLLPFWGQFRHDDLLILVFVSPDDVLWWRAEEGGNAAIVEPVGEYPHWVRPRALHAGPQVLPSDVLVPVDPLTTGEPHWIQHDDTPPSAPEFVAEVRAEWDLRAWPPADDLGYMYLFVSADRRRARVLFQS
ncbi:hypothetical protein [Nonomuraea sp. NPDC050643]|uniref:hypothetical protein n=1 Tax=Nonomuraea sp. NPDC050643 TaxID=3155660 RepID=UPI0033D9B872